MLIKLLYVFVLLIVSVNNSNGFSYPEEGVYIGINSAFVSSIASQFTSLFENQINQYHIPDYSGSEGKDKYDFSSISQSVKLGDFYYSQTGANQYSFGFKSITFTIHTDFKVCVHKLVDQQIELCEHGHVTINSQATLSSTSNLLVNFDASPATVKCSTTTINVPSNGINYDVHCTSKICDKTHDIRDKVEQEFIPNVQTSITTVINGMISKYEEYFSTLKPLNMQIKDNSLYLNSEGYLSQSNVSSALTPTLIYSVNGGVVVKNSKGQYIYPSQKPSYLPNYKAVEEFSSHVSLVLTPYFFETLIDAGFVSLLPYEITNAMLVNSPVQLNTNDPFFNQTAPGLTAKYPHKSMTVSINTPSTPIISINKTGINIRTGVNADFYVESVSSKVFSVGFAFSIEITPSLKQVSNGFNISGTLDFIEVLSAHVSYSSVGSVDTLGFVQLIQLVQSFIKIPMINMKNPLTGYSISSLSFTDNNEFIQILIDLIKTKSNVNQIILN